MPFEDIQKKLSKDDNSKGEQPAGKPPAPVTPKMLMKTLRTLKKKNFKSLFFTPKDVTLAIRNMYPQVEQEYELLLMEVEDKLVCASAAGLIGSKQDVGFYAFDFRQQGTRSDTKSELMFWIFYKKLLAKKMENGRKMISGGNSTKKDGFDFQKKLKSNEKKLMKLDQLRRKKGLCSFCACMAF